MKRLLLSLLLLSSSLALAQPDIDKVNSSIRTEVGATYGSLSTVNGSIRVESGVTAAAVETVNGSVTVADNATLDSAETVNGTISIGENSTVKKGLESVSGTIRVGAGTRVGGGIETVNGSVFLTHAQVAESIESVNGSISLQASKVQGNLELTNGNILVGRDSLVHGDIIVRKSSGIFSWFGKSKPPKVTIEAGATVEGRLVFEREVQLSVDPGANVTQSEPVER